MAASPAPATGPSGMANSRLYKIAHPAIFWLPLLEKKSRRIAVVLNAPRARADGYTQAGVNNADVLGRNSS
jgi:hypothetical protein